MMRGTVHESVALRGRPAPLAERYGRLRVIGRESHFAICICDCGSNRRVDTSKLRNGETRSCGCLAREISSTRDHSTHGMTHTATYRSWQKMRDRCSNPKNDHWKLYGGRGIVVCERWRDSFENFLADMGTRPAGCTLDRFPNRDGNYEPGNCRWATSQQQGRNTRRCRPITAFGETKLMVEWSEDPRCAVGVDTLRARLRRGFEPEWSISEPPLALVPPQLRAADESRQRAEASRRGISSAADRATMEFRRLAGERRKVAA
jgi:hypothetical protein